MLFYSRMIPKFRRNSLKSRFRQDNCKNGGHQVKRSKQDMNFARTRNSKKLRSLRKKVATERIEVLFNLAKEYLSEYPDLAQRYAQLARKIAMKMRVHIPPKYKRLICKHCKKFILPGRTCRIRLQPRREPHIVITCLLCSGITRIPIKGRRDGSIKSKIRIIM
jgi:ribonuclease P protein subunit RPR2